MSDLKPCPHCGEDPIEQAIEAHKHYLVNLPDYPGSYVIECVCGAGSIGETRDEAKTKWNRRAHPAQAVPLLLSDDPLFVFAQEVILGAYRPDELKDAAMRAIRHHGAVLAKRVPTKLWLWKNFVNGRPEYWAFDNAFPVHLNCGDPQTLGEPCGYALFKPSRNACPEVSDAEVLRRVGIVGKEGGNVLE